MNLISRVLFQLVFFLCSSCSQSSDSILEENMVVQEHLFQRLSQVKDMEDLLKERLELERLFNQLVDVAINAQIWSDRHENSLLPISERCEKLSYLLEITLNRVRRIEGADLFLRDIQAGALERLDTFEQKRVKKKVGKL